MGALQERLPYGVVVVRTGGTGSFKFGDRMLEPLFYCFDFNLKVMS